MRANNIEIFQDTLRTIEEGSYPFEHSYRDHAMAMRFSEARLPQIVARPERKIPANPNARLSVEVANEDSYSCAIRLSKDKEIRGKRNGSHVLVMNFANDYTPGGGVVHGANAQEEGLCRTSTLYVSLLDHYNNEPNHGYYRECCANSRGIGTDGMLISPCVEVFKRGNGSLLEKPITVAVGTIAAPVAYQTGLSTDELKKVFKNRITGYLHVAYELGYDTLVLGAWGCGAFGNDPAMVSQAFAKCLDEFRGAPAEGSTQAPTAADAFAHIAFAVLDRKDGYNYTTFKETFQG